MTQATMQHPFESDLVLDAPGNPGDAAVQGWRWIRSPDQVRQAINDKQLKGPQPLVAMSTVAIVAWLPLAWLFPDPLPTPEAAGATDRVAAAQERTRKTLRLLAHLAADFGQILPVVGVIGPDPGMEAEPQDLLAAVRPWPTQQDWHRGEFALYVEESFQKLKHRCRDVLSPRLPEVGPVRPRTRAEQVEELATVVQPALDGGGDGGNALDAARALVERWLSAVEEVKVDKKSSELVARDRHEKALTSLEEWLQPDRNNLDLQGGTPPSPTGDDGSSQGTYPRPLPQSRDPKPVGRVCSVDLCRIRGWTGEDIPTKLPDTDGLYTDADIILINAPNGRGKSSLLQAMSLAITGRAPQDESGSVSYGPGEDGAERQRRWPGTIKIQHGDDAKLRFELHFELHSDPQDQWAWTMEEKTQTFKRPDVLEDAAKGPDAHPAPTTEPRRWWPGTHMHRMLQYRLTSYFPEQVRDQFDHVQRTATLVSHLRPVPEAFVVLQDAARTLVKEGTVEALAAGSRDRAAQHADEHVERLYMSLDKALSPLHDLLGAHASQALPDELLGHLGVVREALDGIRAAKDPQACLQRARDGQPAPQPPNLASLVRFVDTLVPRDERGGAIVLGVDEELDRLHHELARIRERIAWLSAGQTSAELGAWEALLYAGGPPPVDADQEPLLLEVLDGIRRLREATPSTPPADADARRLHAELSLVRLDQLADLDHFARALHSRHLGEVAELQDLRRQEAALRRAIDQRAASADVSARSQALLALRAGLEEWAPAVGTARAGRGWTALSSAWTKWSDLAFDLQREERQQRALAHAEWLETRARAALVGLGEEAQGTDDADRELAKTINESVQKVLDRFAIAASTKLSDASNHLQQLTAGGQVHRYRDISLAGGVLHEAELSTGTRTQVAIAELVGQKLVALSDSLPGELRIPNRVILLDDVSSAYDLTNLVRESLLWRQLAFHPDRSKRLQLFIGTHHETMTNRLYDLLTPPPGCRVIVHQLTDWSLGEGPKVEPFELAPCHAPDWSDLAATLHQELT